MARASRQSLLAVLLLLALALIVPAFINVKQYRGAIATALGRAFGREVSVGGVALQVLPQPGFVLSDLIVKDDESFSAEPMLRASQVTATLRLTSLWRGRLEIAKLSLKEPSLNLVRRADGMWNVMSLLQRAQQAPTAPTARVRPEQRPRFPYVDATGARINWKQGVEKKMFALTDADFALWLAAEDEWRVRLDARPLRTDSDLSDSGRIVGEGWFERRAELAASALHLRLHWRDAQLGQMTKLVYGRDRGWRGATDVRLEANGTARELALRVDATVDGFRRYDITPRSSLSLAAHCAALLQPVVHTLRGIDCSLPAGGGALTAAGNIEWREARPFYDLRFTALQAPAQYAVALLQRAKKDVADDFAASGTVTAQFAVRTLAAGANSWSGEGESTLLRLRGGELASPLDLAPGHFAIAAPAPSRARRGRLVLGQPEDVADPFRLVVAPLAMDLGEARSAQARAVITPEDYEIDLQGEADVPRLLQLARSVGLRAPASVSQGSARIDLAVAGTWAGFTGGTTAGMAQVSGVVAAVAGLAEPLHIASARVDISRDEVAVHDLVATAGEVSVTGSLVRPRGCVAGPQCAIEFSLASDRVALDDVNRLLNPRLQAGPWYRRLTGPSAPSPAPALYAHGRIAIARLIVKRVIAQNVVGTLDLTARAATLTEASGKAFGGVLRGEWRAEFSGDAPMYSGNGTAQHMQMAEVAAAMNDDWAAGSLDGDWHLTLTGWDSRGLGQSAAGSLDFDWRDGMLRHLALGSRPAVPSAVITPMRIRRFEGRATLRAGSLTLEKSRLEAPDGIYTVSGSASLGRELALRFDARSRSYDVSGTLQAPQVAARAAETRTLSR